MSTRNAYVPPQRIGFKTLDKAATEAAASLVARAMAEYGLHGYRLAEIIQHSNVTAKLVSDTGPQLALRLRVGPAVDGATEFRWLNAVRRGTCIRVVEPFADDYASNTRVVENDDGALTECSLFHWAEGQPLAAVLTPKNYVELGRMTAELHTFSSGWTPPSGMKPLIWDRTMYYEGSSLVIPDARFNRWISGSDACAVNAVVKEADDELSALASGPNRMFLHGNIEMWNVLATVPGELRLLDFEDVMFGNPVQDVAITLYYGRERSDYLELCAAYEAGYRSLREWPVRDGRQLELLVAARAVMLLNHALLTEPDPQSVIERLLPLILTAAH